jgi:hypothetical protein
LLVFNVHGSSIAIYFVFKLYCFPSSTLPLVISILFHIVIYRIIEDDIDIAIFGKYRIEIEIQIPTHH